MSIPAPGAGSAPLAAPIAPASADSHAAGISAPAITNEDIVLIDSKGVHEDGSTWQIGDLNKQRLDPSFPTERVSTLTTITDSSLSGRVKMSLSELSDAHRSSFMDKLRSLASAIKRIFVSTHPSTPSAAVQPQPAASQDDRPSYASVIDAVKSSPETPGQKSAQQLIDKFAKLDEACREIPQTIAKIKTDSRDKVNALLLESSIIKATQDLKKTAGKNNAILNVISHNAGAEPEKNLQLQEHVKEAVNIIDKVLKQKYQPSNPKLVDAFILSKGPDFVDFHSVFPNSYMNLKLDDDFGKADDQEVRAWLSKGLETIETASRSIAEAIINHDDSISAASALHEFESASKQNNP